MKKAKFALKCAGTLAVTGVCAGGILIGSSLIGATSDASARDMANRAEQYTVKKIQPYKQTSNEENACALKKEITAMEAPDFEETIEKMRRLTPEEIDEMYERFKNDITG